MNRFSPCFTRRAPGACASRRPLRTTVLACAGLMSGAALLLAGCSQAGPASSSGSPGFGPARVSGGSAHANGAALSPAAPELAGPGTPTSGGSGSSQSAAQPTLPGPGIIFTASLTVRSSSVATAAARATSIAEQNGGYISDEQASIHPAGHARPTVSIQLKIPVSSYQLVLTDLSALGTQLSLSQQAQDVTEQVADVSSRVASAQAAITQLQALLARAGSIADLLSVQEEINSQESSLEALEAQQRALASETSYATVSLTLVSPAPARHAARPASPKRHGFTAGLAAGWHGLRVVVSAILTAVGAALPFAVIAAVLAGAGYAARRPLRRALHRRSRPTPAD
jgi:hypothetical protein